MSAGLLAALFALGVQAGELVMLGNVDGVAGDPTLARDLRVYNPDGYPFTKAERIADGEIFVVPAGTLARVIRTENGAALALIIEGDRRGSQGWIYNGWCNRPDAAARARFGRVSQPAPTRAESPAEIPVAAIYLLGWLVSAICFGAFGAWIATQRRRSPLEGAMVGTAFLAAGVIVEALLPLGETSAKLKLKLKPKPALPSQGDGMFSDRAEQERISRILGGM